MRIKLGLKQQAILAIISMMARVPLWLEIMQQATIRKTAEILIDLLKKMVLYSKEGYVPTRGYLSLILSINNFCNTQLPKNLRFDPTDRLEQWQMSAGIPRQVISKVMVEWERIDTSLPFDQNLEIIAKTCFLPPMLLVDPTKGIAGEFKNIFQR
jgi:hypothetical protein